MQAVQEKLWNFDQPMSYRDVLTAVNEAGNWVTRGQVARELRRSKSPTLIALLGELVESGYLAAQLLPLPNGVDMYKYSITETGVQWLLMDGA